MSGGVIDIFLQCDQAIQRGRLIHRINRADKEFHFQDWFQETAGRVKGPVRSSGDVMIRDRKMYVAPTPFCVSAVLASSRPRNPFSS